VDRVVRHDCNARSTSGTAGDQLATDRSFPVGDSMRLNHRAFTLVELIAAVAIAGIAAGLITATLTRQQKFFSSAEEVLAVRAQLRDGADILASDIRSASVAQFGLPVMTDTAIEMLTVIASSVVCMSPSATTIGLPPSELVSGNTLTAMLASPDTGDLAAIYSAPGGVPDSSRWDTYRVSGFTPRSIATSCPSSTGFLAPADEFAGASGFLLTLASSPSVPLRKGSIVHFIRRARYSLYRSSDGEWYLGYRRCGVSAPHACGSIQPVSGPYRPYRSGGPSGMSFRYYDSGGSEVTSTASSNVARIDIVLRGKAPSVISLAGDSRREWRDSVIVSVSPRNRAR
jgi:prepilin-type N-terminal cleavage/methylation domain-containing protein